MHLLRCHFAFVVIDLRQEPVGTVKQEVPPRRRWFVRVTVGLVGIEGELGKVVIPTVIANSAVVFLKDLPLEKVQTAYISEEGSS